MIHDRMKHKTQTKQNKTKQNKTKRNETKYIGNDLFFYKKIRLHRVGQGSNNEGTH